MGYLAGLNIAGLGINPPIDDPTGIASLKNIAESDFIQRKSGLWVNRSIAQVRADLNSQETISSDAAFSLLIGVNAEKILHTATLTADRAVTLSTLNAARGAKFHITRTGAGAFVLNIGTGPLKALRQNQWAEFTFDGTNWYLSNFGVLDIVPAMEFVQSITVNGSQYADFTTGFVSGFDEYVFNITSLYSTTSSNLTAQVSENGGSSWYTPSFYTSTYYTSGYIGSSGGVGVVPSFSYNQTCWYLSPYGISNSSSTRDSLKVHVTRNNAVHGPQFTAIYQGQSMVGPAGGFLGVGAFGFNAIRFHMNQGSYAWYGKIDMFRVKNT